MTNGREKSDSAMSHREADEQGGAIRCGAGGAKGGGRRECGPAKHAPGAGPGKPVTGAGPHTASRKAKEEGEVHCLFHHLTIDRLEDAFGELKEDAAAGADGLTWTEYKAALERNLEDLHARLRRGAYRASPSRRTYMTEAGRPTAPARDRRSRRQGLSSSLTRGSSKERRPQC